MEVRRAQRRTSLLEEETMSEPTVEERVLSEAALQPQAGIDPDSIARQTRNLMRGLGWIFGGPPLLSKYSLAAVLELPALTAAKGYLSYYSFHFTVLARVLASVEKGEPIDAEISRLEQNFKDYIAKTNDFVRHARADVPASPFAGMPSAAAFFVVLTAAQLKRDPRFVQEWNTYLGINQVLMENAVEVAKYLGHEGDQIYRETPARLDELRKAVDAITGKISLDVVLKYRYKERIDWIQVLVLPEVSAAASAANSVAGDLERGPLAAARSANRL
jgi:hypothetical protein